MLVYNEVPWKLERNEVFRLPWYSFFLLFLDSKKYREFKERTEQINKWREEEKKKKFEKKKPKCPPAGTGGKRSIPQNKSQIKMPKVKQPKPEPNTWESLSNETWGSLQSRQYEFIDIKNIPSNPIWLPQMKNEDSLPLIGVVPGTMVYIKSIQSSVMWNGANWILVTNLPPDISSKKSNRTSSTGPH